jgi:serine protease
MRVVSVFLRHRPLIASTGLLALAGLLAAVHRPIHNDAPEPAPLTVAEAGIHGTGASSSTSSSPRTAKAAARPSSQLLLAELGLAYEPAGFYSEGEHLFRVFGEQAALAELQVRLQHHPLVEVVEPELEYSLIEVPEISEGPLAPTAG